MQNLERVKCGPYWWEKKEKLVNLEMLPIITSEAGITSTKGEKKKV